MPPPVWKASAPARQAGRIPVVTATDPDGCRPPGCKQADASCGPSPGGATCGGSGPASQGNTSARVIPNTNIAFIQCPMDVPGCANDPNSNKSGQTLLDANLLKLRITYGIPERKQIPLAGRFMNWALGQLNSGDTDTFRLGLVKAGRIPVVTHIVMRMQSPALENANASSPGPGNGGEPKDPGPLPKGDPLPTCPATDPACGATPKCDASTDPNGCLPPSCKMDDPTCDPMCGVNKCCQAAELPISKVPGAPGDLFTLFHASRSQK